jgi:hypothetical protein
MGFFGRQIKTNNSTIQEKLLSLKTLVRKRKGRKETREGGEGDKR